MRLRPSEKVRLVVVAAAAVACLGACARGLPHGGDAWVQVETPHFTVFGDAPEADVRTTALQASGFGPSSRS